MDAQDGTRMDGLTASEALSGRADFNPLPEAVLQMVTRGLVQRYVNKDSGAKHIEAPVLEEPPNEELDRFCDMLTDADPSKARWFFNGIQQDGKTTDALSLRYIAPAARRLGERWVKDECSFLEVTLGTSRLHGLQRSLRGDFVPANLDHAPELTALFTVTPGDTHVLGVTMAADFFRRAGWTVDLNTAPEMDALLAKACLSTYAVVGISVGAYPDDGRLEETAERLRELQPSTRLILGGRVADLDPELVSGIGADMIVDDITTAPLSLQSKLSLALKD